MKSLGIDYEAKVILWVSVKTPGRVKVLFSLKKKKWWFCCWLQTAALIGQMTKQDLTKIKQLLDEFLLMLKIWSHKRNNEAEESQYSGQLSQPLLLIFAGILEMDKPPPPFFFFK